MDSNSKLGADVDVEVEVEVDAMACLMMGWGLMSLIDCGVYNNNKVSGAGAG